MVAGSNDVPTLQWQSIAPDGPASTDACHVNVDEHGGVGPTRGVGIWVDGTGDNGIEHEEFEDDI